MILLSKTYETWSHEDLEAGETDDKGFEFEDVPHTFRELVRLLKHEFRYPSCSPASGNPYEWVSTEPDTNFRTGEETTYSLHYSHKNPSRNEKYWAKAMECAGRIKPKTPTKRVLRYETYVCSLTNSNLVEYGYCFKYDGSEDSEIDLVIDVLTIEAATPEVLDAGWDKFKWAAKAVCDAAPFHKTEITI